MSTDDSNATKPPRLPWHKRRLDRVLFKPWWLGAPQFVLIYLLAPLDDCCARIGSKRVVRGPLKVVGAGVGPLEEYSYPTGLQGLRCQDCGESVKMREHPPLWRWAIGTLIVLVGLVSLAAGVLDPWWNAESRWRESGFDQMVALGLNRDKIDGVRVPGRLISDALGSDGPKLFATNGELYKAVDATIDEQRALVDVYLGRDFSKEGRAAEAALSSRNKYKRDMDAHRPFLNAQDYEWGTKYAALGLLGVAIGWRLRRVRAGLECSGCRRVLAL